jgi:hypothetical protein
MRKQTLKKMTIARETLRRLEEQGLQDALGGSHGIPAPSYATACICVTELCVSANYTGCTTCNS